MKTYRDVPLPAGLSRQPSRPSIKANHVDGPMLVFSDGQVHWLTPWERLLFAMRWTDADKLQRKRRKSLLT